MTGLYGAITEAVLYKKSQKSINDYYARLFEVCEVKNDYSFIYTNNQRNTTTGYRAYPQAAPVKSIASWHSEGALQKAVRNATGFYLDGMLSMQSQAILGTNGKNFLDDFYSSGIPEFANITFDGSDASYAATNYEILKLVGFTGSSTPLYTENGMFFPQSEVAGNVTFLAATQVSWSFGSPGLALVQNSTTGVIDFVPGAFMGFGDSTAAREVALETFA